MGDIILMPLDFDPKSAAIAFHSLTLGRRPRFSHCGIYAGNGKMYTASGKVTLQDAGATGNIAVPYKWQDWNKAEAILKGAIGESYDWFAWILAAVSPITRFFYNPVIDTNTFTCSALVAFALFLDNPKAFAALDRRVVTPDDVAAAVQS